MDLIGSTIEGKYKILSVLGSGGSGTVYKAEQEDLSRFVAIKVLHKNSDRSDDRLKLVREAKNLSAGGQESSIIKVFAVGLLDDDSPYLVMEFVEGQTLDVLIQQKGPLPVTFVTRLGVQIAQALAVAHASKIIHRDLKPANILIEDRVGEPFVKVLDFGLAKNLSQSSSLAQRNTATGAIVGSIAYMAPEVCAGQQASERSDIYALGCILYECLAGQAAFVSDNILALLNMHRDALPKPLRDTRNNVPEQLELIVFKCLQKDPKHRFSSADEVIDSLNALASGSPLDMTLAGVVLRDDRSIRQQRRSKLFFPLFAALLVLIGIAGVGLIVTREKIGKVQNRSGASASLQDVVPKKRLLGINSASIESRTSKLIEHYEGIADAGSNSLEEERSQAVVSEADGIIKDTKKPEILYLAWYLKGRTYNKLGEDRKSLESYQQATKCAIQAAGGREPFQVVYAYSGIIHQAEALGEYRIAESAGLKAIRLLEERSAGKEIPLIDVPLKDDNNRLLNFFGLAIEREFYFRVARSQLALGKLKEARMHAEKALLRSEELGRGTVYVRTVLADILSGLKETKQARKQAETCESLLVVERQKADRGQLSIPSVSAIFTGTENRDPKVILEQHRMLANYYLKYGYKSDAVRVFKIAIDFAKEFNLSPADIEHMQKNVLNLESQLVD